MPESSAATVFGIMSWNGVLRQFDLDAGLGLEFLDRFQQRIVLGLVEALAEPDGMVFAGPSQVLWRKNSPTAASANETAPNPLNLTLFSLNFARLINRLGKTLAWLRPDPDGGMQLV